MHISLPAPVATGDTRPQNRQRIIPVEGVAVSKQVFVTESGQSAENGLAERLRALGNETLSTENPARTAQLLAGRISPDLLAFNVCPLDEFSETLRLVRSNAHIAHIPVLAVVSDDDSSGQDRLAAGAQAYANLPFNQKALGDAIAKALAKPRIVTQPPQEVLNAPDRLEDLRETQLLDSLPCEELDRLTRLASRLLGAPMSLISLVDNNRQFFKSQTGLGPPLSQERQTDLSVSFCQWVVSGGAPLTVDNAKEHPVLKHNPAARDVAAYAGVPLLGRRRKPIGSFCVADTTPRHWEHDQIELLKDLGAAIEAISVSNTVAARQASAAGNWPPQWVSLIGEGVLGAVRVLRRYGERLHAQDRKDLLDVIEHQTSLLLKGGTQS